jgi:hypothetical protein
LAEGKLSSSLKHVCTYQNELEQGGLVDIDKILLPSLHLIGTPVNQVVVLAKLDNLCKDSRLHLPHRDLHARFHFHV